MQLTADCIAPESLTDCSYYLVDHTGNHMPIRDARFLNQYFVNVNPKNRKSIVSVHVHQAQKQSAPNEVQVLIL